MPVTSASESSRRDRRGRERRILAVHGTVQGVGFRPFVARLAARFRLCGTVANRDGHVAIDVEGQARALAAFERALHAEAPPLARIERVEARRAPTAAQRGFVIAASDGSGQADVSIAPDAALCAACERELGDPRDRRAGYAFTSCTDCGPRFTLVREAPFDRARTSMAPFALCAACRGEYGSAQDRRHHAETNACAACGPRLALEPADPAREPLAAAAALLRGGSIVAVQGIGGFHLACDARSSAAVSELRRRKRRPERPLGVMVESLAAAEELCHLTRTERELLTSAERPIVLLERRAGCALAAGLAPGLDRLGLLLPYSPLHVLLLREVGRPLVMTSANPSSEPLVYRIEEAAERLAPLADAVLRHDREIVTPCDDSVAHCAGERPILLRRARGHVPRAIALAEPGPPLLAVGGHLKATFALGWGDRAVVSQHLGDLGSLASSELFARTIEHFERLYRVRPERIAHDAHPDYASTLYAERRCEAEGLQRIAVQHHHAHIVSCMAEHGVRGPVIGVAFDGTGAGSDGASWGGEFLLADARAFTRLAQLRYVRLPGGDRTARHPWRSACVYLLESGLPLDGLGCAGIERDLLERQWRDGRGVLSSSAGRLFDAVAGLAGLRGEASYEGQAAIELEDLARRSADPGAYAWDTHEAEVVQLDPRPVIAAVWRDVRAGVAPADIARRFHRGLAHAVAETCLRLASRCGIGAVALGGGVFCNALLVAELSARLERAGLTCLVPRRLPPNDGGLSLGQLAIARAQRA